MARLLYRPVAAPNVSSAANSVSRAAAGIGAGLNQIGASITGLGERRQARQDEQRARNEAKALEQFRLLGEQVSSEEELGQLTTQLLNSEGNLPGGADAIAGRREDLLSNSLARAQIGTEQGATQANRALAEGRGINNSLKALELDSAKTADEIQKTYGPQMTETLRLFDEGQIEEGLALRQNTAEAIGREYGANASSIFLENTRTFQSLGNNTRTEAADNALSLRTTGLKNQGLSIDNQNAITTNEDSNRTRDYQFGRTVLGDERADEAFEKQERVGQLVDEIIQDTNSRKDALFTADRMENLSAEERNAVALGIDKIYAERPDIQDLSNPLDPDLSTTDRYLAAQGEPEIIKINGKQVKTEAPGNFIAANTVSEMQGNIDSVINTRDSFQIYNRAKTIDAELSEQGTGADADMGALINSRYPTLKGSLKDSWLNTIDDIQSSGAGKRRLTSGELLAILDISSDARGPNAAKTNLWPGGEKASERVLDVYKARKIAADYRKNNIGNLRSEIDTLRQYKEDAPRLENRINSLQDERLRAINKNEDTSSLDRRIRELRNQLIGMNEQVKSAAGTAKLETLGLATPEEPASTPSESLGLSNSFR